MKTKIVNLFGGPGTGKSTTAAGLFSELKLSGVNCEYVQEYAKDKAWEFGGTFHSTPKLFNAQEYIFGKQHFRLRRLIGEVDVIITDCPIFLGLIYMPDDFPLPSLRNVIFEAYDLYDNLNVFLHRVKGYNPKGRFQSEKQAQGLDVKIRSMLDESVIPYYQVNADRMAVSVIVDIMKQKWPSLLPDSEEG